MSWICKTCGSHMEEDGYCVICDHLSATARSDKSEIVIDSNSQEIFLKAKKQRM